VENRREVFRRAALGAAFFGLAPDRAERAFTEECPRLPATTLHDTDAERYWAELRRQWLIAPDHINLNCGSVGCSPLPVLNATIDHMLSAESFREPAYPWFGYEENPRLRELRDSLAAFLHCRRDELALVRNATEANNVVCNGLDFKTGDEVLLTDQEHPGGRCCWEQKAARQGIVLTTVTLPRPPASVDEIVGRFAKAMTPRTRIVVFSHITSPTGTVLPAKELCRLARDKGVLSHVDGAHAIGQIPLDLPALGCDFYGSSPHKWLLAPKGTGTLYIREELLERLWVTIATNGWRDHALKAYRFSNFGTSNLSIMVGLKAALDFHRTIGSDRIYTRIHQLASRVRDKLKDYPQLRIANASTDAFFGGMVSFEPVKGDLKRVMTELAARNVRVAGGPERIRVATHIFTQSTELNTFFDAVDRGLRG
jgi:selenocysteine lyase/cysteine desulfurase